MESMEDWEAEVTDSMSIFVKNVVIPNFSSKNELHGFRLTMAIAFPYAEKQLLH